MLRCLYTLERQRAQAGYAQITPASELLTLTLLRRVYKCYYFHAIIDGFSYTGYY